MKLLSLLVTAGFALGACDAAVLTPRGDSDDSPDLSTAVLELVSGGEQVEGTVGGRLEDPVVVRVVDEEGEPIGGAPVRWTFSAGRGVRSASAPSDAGAEVVVDTTASDGTTQVWWELGTSAGVQTLSAEIVAPEAEVSSEVTAAPGKRWRWLRFSVRARPGTVSAIAITPDEVTVGLADTLHLVAAPRDAWGNPVEGVEVSWSSSDEDVATVATSGAVHPVAEGSATITARAGEVRGEASVTVVTEQVGGDTPGAAPARVLDLRVREVTSTSVTLRWTAVDDGNGGAASYAVRMGSPTLSWGPAASTQVLVSGTRPGTTVEHVWNDLEPGTQYQFQLVAYRGSFGSQITFSQLSNVTTSSTQANGDEPPADDDPEPPVDEEPEPPTDQSSLQIQPSSATLVGIGTTRQLTVAARDSAGSAVSPLIAWESLDPSVATVNGSGVVQARGVGVALIVASAACCGADTARVTVENPVDVEGLLLQADWSTATGNSMQAVSDGGKGEVRWCNWSDVLSVVSGSSVNWTRTSNVLAIRSVNSCGHVEFENVFPRPQAGQYWAVRYYAMNGPGQTDTKMHPHTFWPVGAIEAVHLGITTQGRSGGDWVMHPRWTFSNNAFPWGLMPKSSSGQVQYVRAGEWVRYEFILHWLSSTTFRWYPRVYDMAGNLLWDEYDFRHTDTNQSLGDWYDASPSNVLTRASGSSSPDNIRTISFGMGQAGSSGGRYYIADVALALVNGRDQFIGASAP